MDRIKLQVVYHEGGWRLRLGEFYSRPFITEREAIDAALRQARKLGGHGRETDVVMKAMTCRYNDRGLMQAFPTPRSDHIGDRTK